MEAVKDFLIEKEKTEIKTVKIYILFATLAFLLMMLLIFRVYIAFLNHYMNGIDIQGLMVFGFIFCITSIFWTIGIMNIFGNPLSIYTGLKKGNFTYRYENIKKILRKNGEMPVIETEEGSLYELPQTEEVALGNKLLVATIKNKKRAYIVPKDFKITGGNSRLLVSE